MPAPSLALCFATIERPQVAQRLIRSARANFGDMPIYVADQSREVEAMSSFYESHGVTLLRMPFDCGVTASRNRLARAIKEDYFVLCDDDFIMAPQTDFADAAHILATHPEIGVVGGRLYDFDGNEEWTRNWEIYLQYDPQQKILFSIPIFDLAPRAREVAGVRFYLCDAVLNFSVMRRSMFEAGVAWDERYKSNGEHEDFFLNLKLNTPWRVAYLPTMRAYHHHPEEYQRYRRALRDRNEGWKRMFLKWGLEQHVEFGLGVKTIDDIDAVDDERTARARFYLNADLSLRREQPAPDALLVNLDGGLATVGALNAAGDRIGPARGDLGRLLLDSSTGRLVPADVAPGRQPAPARSRAEADPRTRYHLETSAEKQAVSYFDGELHYRYDASLRSNADFLVWYWRKAPKAAPGERGRRLAVVTRWSDPQGEALIWRSRRSFIDLEGADHWRPLLLQTPLAPPGARWLRFDIVTDGGEQSEPICTGVVAVAAEAGADGRGDARSFQTLAISRLPKDGAQPGVAGRPLAELARTSRPFPVAVRRAEFGADLSVLPLADCADLEALYFVNWDCLGRALVSARLPAGDFGTPGGLALPAEGWGAPGARVYGFGRRTGLVTIEASAAALGGGA